MPILLQGIADQKVTLEKLIPLMETYKENQNVSDVLKSLSTIKLAYDELKAVDNKVTMTTDSFKKIKKEVGSLKKKSC